MQGQLTPEQQLQVLARIWGNDRKGYAFLPYINGWTRSKDERRKNFHEGRAFRWPKQRSEILDHLVAHAEDDLYFAPNLFDGKRRIEQNVAPEKVLYADLDPVDPGQLGDLRPTIAWESSPGHFQGIWIVDRERTGASWPGKENHRLTVALEADPSGWDATQLLRVPGRPNYKFEYKEKNNGKPVTAGGLLWADGPRYVWSDFDDLPSVGAVVGDDVEMIDEEVIESVDRHEVWARVRLKVSAKCREYLALKTDPAGVADRDQVLWQIERDLADAGCTLIEIVAIVRPSVWNKYKGRNDELKRLKIEAAKAINARPDDLEETVEQKPNITWLKDVIKEPIPRPKWLVKDIWTRAGCGFIAGAPKSYKSWMGLDLALSVATGTSFLNQPQFRVAKPETVLYLQEEDNLALVMDRLANILESKAPTRLYHGTMAIVGGDTQRDLKLSVPPSARSGDVIWAPPVGDVPLALHVQTGFMSSDPGWQAWLDEVLAEGEFALVIIDTLSTTTDTDMDKTGDMMTHVLKPLKQLAHKHDAAICIIHHNKKAATDEKGRRAGNDMLGAVGLHAWVDCAIYARSKDAKGEVAIEREAKLAQEMTMRVQIPLMFWDQRTGERKLWDPEIITEGLETIQEVAEQPAPTRAGTGGKMLASKIKGMGGGPFTLEDLTHRLDMAAAPLLRQLNAGVENGFIDQVSDDEWRVPRS